MKKFVAVGNMKLSDLSEIAYGVSSFASTKGKPAISEHAQNNTLLALARGCFDIAELRQVVVSHAAAMKRLRG